MLHRLDGGSVCRLVLLPGAMANKLLARLRVLALTQPCKMLRVDCSREAVVLGHLSLPFSENRIALFPVILLGRHELFCMVRLGLAGTEGLGDGEHRASLLLKRKRGLWLLIAIGLGGIFRDSGGDRDQDKLLFGGLVKLQLLGLDVRFV